MTSFAPLAITGFGGVTAVGDEIAQVCTSIRAGFMGFAEHAFHRPLEAEEDDARLSVAPVDGLDPRLAGPPRLLTLAAWALRNLAESTGRKLGDLHDAALLLALPALDAAVESWDLASSFLAELRQRTELPLAEVVVVQAGSTGMLELLGHTGRLLSGRRERCILLGVESYLAPDRLALLDTTYRAKSRRNVDGFLPGEAATAVLLETPRGAAARREEVHAIVSAVGLGNEPETFASDKQSSGKGLTEALRLVLRPGAPGAGPYVLCDLNGESYRAIEWGLVQVRLGDALGSVEKLLHPANCHGDIGAATAGALMAVAATSFRRGYAPEGQSEAILFCGGDGPVRAAARLERA